MTTEKPKVVKKVSSSPNGKSKPESKDLSLTVSPVVEISGKKVILTPQQRRFCYFYFENGGNATRAYVMAYNLGNKDLYDLPVSGLSADQKIKRNKMMTVAAVSANQTLKLPKIWKYIDQINKATGFCDERVDFEHTKLILQDKDLSSKGRGIDMYNKLKNRYPNPMNKDWQTPEEIEEAILYIRRILPRSQQ